MGGKISPWTGIADLFTEVVTWVLAAICFTEPWWTTHLPDYEPRPWRNTAEWMSMGVVFAAVALRSRRDRLFEVDSRLHLLLFVLGFVGIFYFHDN